MNIVSLFSGAGGLDLGFEKAGFNVIWANEFNPTIFKTFNNNHRSPLCTTDIREINADNIPNCDGIIGGPPCQSWSIGGDQKGFEDPRGLLFLDYIRIINAKNPLFFIAENVPGLLMQKNLKAYNAIIAGLRNCGCGYRIFSKVLNAADYNVPQNRKRLFIIGFKRDLNIKFRFPDPESSKQTLFNAIYDLRNITNPCKANQSLEETLLAIPNHEFLNMEFPLDYMSYNKVRSWHSQSYTIRTNGKYMLLHPDSPNMERIHTGLYRFKPGYEKKYRRLSVRECARIQTFPDSFIFHYTNILDGYMMVGNSVPVNLANSIAVAIKNSFLLKTN